MKYDVPTSEDYLDTHSPRTYLAAIRIGWLRINYPAEQSYDLVDLVQEETGRLGLEPRYLRVNPRGARYDMYVSVGGERRAVDELFDKLLMVENVVPARL